MNVLQKTTKGSKKAAQQVAKQIARESSEILKTAGSQVTGREKTAINGQVSTPNTQSEVKPQQVNVPSEAELKVKKERLLNANRKELEQIRIQKIFKDIQKRISGEEEVPLENIEGLSMEQKQVLKAQIEAMKKRKAESQNNNQFVTPQGKQKRGPMTGMKGKIQKMKRKAELRKGPSG